RLQRKEGASFVERKPQAHNCGVTVGRPAVATRAQVGYRAAARRGSRKQRQVTRAKVTECDFDVARVECISRARWKHLLIYGNSATAMGRITSRGASSRNRAATTLRAAKVFGSSTSPIW